MSVSENEAFLLGPEIFYIRLHSTTAKSYIFATPKKLVIVVPRTLVYGNHILMAKPTQCRGNYQHRSWLSPTPPPLPIEISAQDWT